MGLRDSIVGEVHVAFGAGVGDDFAGNAHDDGVFRHVEGGRKVYGNSRGHTDTAAEITIQLN